MTIAAFRLGGPSGICKALADRALGICIACLLSGLTLHVASASPLRICADPDNMPFSNAGREGFENELAELLAKELKRELIYTWFEADTGYVPNTMGSNACDVVMGYAQGTGLIEDTNPYYYTSYVLITRSDDLELKDVMSLADPRLKSKRLGFIARTPPASLLAMRGLSANARLFEAKGEATQSAIAQDVIEEIETGELDAAVLWGPVGGYYAARAKIPLVVTPLVKESSGPKTIYGITLGIRPNEPQFKYRVNKVLAENKDEIGSILQKYNVPVFDQDGQLLVADDGE